MTRNGCFTSSAIGSIEGNSTPLRIPQTQPISPTGCNHLQPLRRAITNSQIISNPITTVQDFNRIMRIGNYVNTAGSPLNQAGEAPGLRTIVSLTWDLRQTSRNPMIPTARVFSLSRKSAPSFTSDFPAKPHHVPDRGWRVSLCNQSPANPAAHCDQGSQLRFACGGTAELFPLSLVSFNFMISISATGNPDLTKRIPGKINVNTASGDVLLPCRI